MSISWHAYYDGETLRLQAADAASFLHLPKRMIESRSGARAVVPDGPAEISFAESEGRAYAVLLPPEAIQAVLAAWIERSDGAAITTLLWQAQQRAGIR